LNALVLSLLLTTVLAAPGVQLCESSPADISGGEVCDLLTFELEEHQDIFVYAADLVTRPDTTNVAFNERLLLVDRSDDTEMFCVILPEMTFEEGNGFPCSTLALQISSFVEHCDNTGWETDPFWYAGP
jgi:hypothetical protein